MRPAPWLVSAASVMGSRHARSVTDCQDSFAAHQEADTLILACADGGSRARLARTASSLAATLAADEARRALPPTGDRPDPAAEAAEWGRRLDRVIRDVVRRFRAAAAAMSSTLSDRDGYRMNQWGTTLTLVMVHRPWLAAVAIGDGFVVTRCGTSHFDLFLPPDELPRGGAGRPPRTTRGGGDADGPPAEPGRTVFVTSPGATGRARRVVARLPDLTGVAVSSDGLRDVGLLHEGAHAVQPYHQFFTPLFAHAVKAGEDDTYLARFLAGERITALTGDDKTLLVAVERP
ncbi:protein phosphatase 2C domain-containing protein [Streptomyces sp. NBC_00829]|uniref:protein phosphatase 2C domain-containing protein n=1 Tax=Streptomyces sp. NBC_00829 TaxID=2903679 RepID=UPI00386CA031|nr:protein phosphatase 2C domain-containing protein [Streptomyces sp. NBC_00829]